MVRTGGATTCDDRGTILPDAGGFREYEWRRAGWCRGPRRDAGGRRGCRQVRSKRWPRLDLRLRGKACGKACRKLRAV